MKKALFLLLIAANALVIGMPAIDETPPENSSALTLLSDAFPEDSAQIDAELVTVLNQDTSTPTPFIEKISDNGTMAETTSNKDLQQLELLGDIVASSYSKKRA